MKEAVRILAMSGFCNHLRNDQVHRISKLRLLMSLLNACVAASDETSLVVVFCFRHVLVWGRLLVWFSFYTMPLAGFTIAGVRASRYEQNSETPK